MQSKKHKRKTNHVVIVTSDAVDANVKQFRVRPWILQTAIVILCTVLGGIIGYLIYEETIWEAALEKNITLANTIEQLKKEKEQLELEKEELANQMQNLDEQIQILSETVNEKVESEKELTAQLEKQSLPTEFPLTGSASMEETLSEDKSICIFTASEGVMAVAAAAGTVTDISDDAEYGHCVRIDHGNGYVTIYRNKGDATVKLGDSVVQGSTLFIIGEDNTKLGYQMMKDGSYINPMDMLAISG